MRKPIKNPQLHETDTLIHLNIYIEAIPEE
jgi:hypothetical protein